MIGIKAAAVSYIGNVRENNEDNYCFFKYVYNDTKDNKKIRSRNQTLKKAAVLGVFDGMGGISAGEKASAIAAETACSILNVSGSQPEDMIKVCHEANNTICNEMLKVRKRMGTTASMLFFKNDRYYLCNLGDSPVFRLRGNTLSRISFSHTENSDKKHKSGKKSRNPKGRLTQYLGIFPDEAGLVPFLAEGKCRVGDKFLLCSDGLSDVITPAMIRRILNGRLSVRKKAQELLDMALNNGGTDNITVICAEIVKPSIVSRIFR